MSGIHKFSKIFMVVSLLFASISWVHAMDPNDPDLKEAIAASLAIVPAQEIQKDLPNGHVYFEGSDQDLLAYIAAQQELDAQERASDGAAPIKQDDITPEEWAIINQQVLEAAQVSRTLWTRDPGKKVPENHPQYRLRADNIPNSQINGGPQNVASMSLGRFIRYDVELNPHRDEEWQKRAEKNEQQMKERRVLHSVPQPAPEQNDAIAALSQLQTLKPRPQQHNSSNPGMDVKNNPFGEKIALKKTPAGGVGPKDREEKKPAANSSSVGGIAAQFGGQGGFKKHEKK